MKDLQFHRKNAYQVCIAELLALDFEHEQLVEIIKNHATQMRNGFLNGIPYYKVASEILKEEYYRCIEVSKVIQYL